MSRKLAYGFGGVALGVVAVWLLIKIASSGYEFGQFLAERDAPTAQTAAKP